MSLAATLAGAAAARGRAYGLFSRFFLRSPDETLIREFGELLASAADAPDPQLARDAQAFAALVREAARAPAEVERAVEHTRLFGGLSERDGLPPVESAIREGRALGESAGAVAIAYAEAGFPEPLPEAGPPDHAAAELRFLALCCSEEGRCWSAGDANAAASWLGRERDFLEAHLAAWLPAYCESAAGRARLPFYASGLRFLATACRVDLEDVREMLARAGAERAKRPG